MKALHKRIAALENTGPANISPAVKLWLGWPVNDAELQAAHDEAGSEVENIDTSEWTTEVKAWLGLD